MIVTKREILAAYAQGHGPLAEAALDEPVFLLRAADFESQDALMAYANVGRGRWRNAAFIADVRAIHDAMKRWFAAHNPALPRNLTAAPGRRHSRIGGAIRRWKAAKP